MKYKFLEHTADVKFLAEGKSLEGAFEASAMALKESICTKIKIKSKINKKISVGGSSLETLLYKFLEEFLVLLDSEDFIFSEIKKIEIDEKKFKLKAEISGDKTKNYKFTNDVKAITYSDMFVNREKNKFLIQVVLDV